MFKSIFFPNLNHYGERDLNKDIQKGSLQILEDFVKTLGWSWNSGMERVLRALHLNSFSSFPPLYLCSIVELKNHLLCSNQEALWIGSFYFRALHESMSTRLVHGWSPCRTCTSPTQSIHVTLLRRLWIPSLWWETVWPRSTLWTAPWPTSTPSSISASWPSWFVTLFNPRVRKSTFRFSSLIF